VLTWQWSFSVSQNELKACSRGAYLNVPTGQTILTEFSDPEKISRKYQNDNGKDKGKVDRANCEPKRQRKPEVDVGITLLL
jgi:hypothetical protein